MSGRATRGGAAMSTRVATVDTVMSSNKLNVQCLCGKYFETEKDIRRHKKADPEHYYCKKCDVDCEDWDDLTRHKVKLMESWLGGRPSDAGADDHPIHITCEFCGEDFKSFGGRKKHHELMHPADQEIYCPGCEEKFTRASHLIEHFEKNKCLKIRYTDFYAMVQQKHVIKQIMQNPGEYAQGVQGRTFDRITSEAVDDDACTEAETQDGTEGGVAVLDMEEPAQIEGYKPLRPEVELINLRVAKKASSTPRSQPTWPKLPTQSGPSVNELLREMALGSPVTDMVPASVYASSITSRKTSRETDVPSLGSPICPMSPMSASVCSDDDNASMATTTDFSIASQPAWTTGNTSKALFKDAKPRTLPEDYWAAVLKERERETVHPSTNLFKSRIWDPQSNEYDVKRFLHPIMNKYCCPMPDCRRSGHIGQEHFEAAYEDPQDFEAHFQLAHLRIRNRCRHCLKLFQTASGLIAHCESAGGSCKVKDTNEFGQMLDEVSGGFLTADSIRQPKVFKQENAMVKQGDVAWGVMSTRFSAVMPEV